ncbi:MAG TPA: branched-chain amino acid ABC transporter permease [Firmicutes bacterium]|jgi:branched-chain amino acid transport system permease protein|nr:branched-chain amino acid ABC transporter permease [Bacillota bacterium]
MTEILQQIVSMIDPYLLQILINISIAIILALGLNLITGLTGQLSLGHAAFMSIGAFTGAILTIKLGMPFFLDILAAGFMAALSGIIIGFPTLRLSGDYLAIATLGFAEIIKVVFLNLDITNRALGLSVPPPNSNVPLAIYVWLLVILAIIIMALIHSSRFGRALKAIREDEIAAESMGINATGYKIVAFSVGAFFAGIGGCLYAHFIAYINPSDFAFSKSIDILNMVVLGGLGSIPGTIVGASLLTTAPEFLGFMSKYRMLVYGAMLVFLMIFRPNGLLGGFSFRSLLLKMFVPKTTAPGEAVAMRKK